MEFSVFSTYLQRLESTTKRLEITAILAEMLKELELLETDKAVYLSLGQLGPQFAQIDFALAEKMMLRILAAAFVTKEEEVQKLYDKIGDIGTVAEELANKTTRVSGQKKKGGSITILYVYEHLLEIALISGTGSQEKKVSKFAELISKLDPLSVRYVTRIPTKNTRLGFSDVTIIEALSWMETGGKSLKAEIESYFHVYPDIGKIAKLFKEGQINGLKKVRLEVGVPILPQLCQRVSTAEEAIEKLGGQAGVEIKYDGTRVQLHMDKKRMVEMGDSDQLTFFDNKKKMPYVRSFTRNLEESTNMFPDLVKAAIEQIDADSVILDGEAVGYDPKTQKMIPFQETSQRKRKHGIMEKVSEIPLRYFVFDLLYLNGKPLLDLSFNERREKLKKIVRKGETIVVDEQRIVEDPEELLEFFNEIKGQGLEGVVMKKLDSKYEAGGRGYSWVKFKREETGGLEDTIDGVILGYYLGKGNRAKFGIGGFLVGLFDPQKDAFTTVCKVGSGPTEEEWQEIKKRVDKIKTKEKPANLEIDKTLVPDVWSKPEIIVVIRADEITVSEVHTAGYALRFPRLMAFREDKSATDSTTPKEIKRLFEIQQNKRK